jgi:nucleoside-diphosphate-sugar epimerase
MGGGRNGMAKSDKRALVTGAYGMVGLNALEELKRHKDWEVVGMGRRSASPLPGLEYVRAELTDAAATKAALAKADCTHLFFGAYQNHADAYKECDINVAMLKNTLDALKAAGAPLRRVLIVEGAKAYGALMGPMRTPAKETDPRVPGPLYYFALQDVLYDYGARHGFNTIVLRPDFIAGIGFGSYTNIVAVVAVFASVCKALGMPLYFPGGQGGYNTLFQITDAKLLARGMVWAAERATPQNEIFNITNGDLFRWSNVWPRIASYFGLEVGQPLTMDLALFMRDKGPLWTDLAKRHELVVRFEDMMNWAWGNSLRVPFEIHTSTIRIRQAGFHDCLDTEDRFLELFDEMRARKFIP